MNHSHKSLEDFLDNASTEEIWNEASDELKGKIIEDFLSDIDMDEYIRLGCFNNRTAQIIGNKFIEAWSGRVSEFINETIETLTLEDFPHLAEMFSRSRV